MDSSSPSCSSARHPSCLRARSLLVAALLSALIASSTSAYVVYLKDGTSFAVQSPYEVNGDRALVVLLSGTQTTLALAEIDVEKTKSLNTSNLGDAVVIEQGGVRHYQIGEAPANSQQSLRERIRSDRARRARDLGAEVRASTPSKRSLPSTLGGYPDLDAMIREPVTPPDQATEISLVLSARGVGTFRLYQGTIPDRLFLELVTDSRQAVMDQLAALCDAFAEVTATSSYQRLEVLMLTSQRSRAGQFVLSRENVPLLANELLSPSEFFLQFVQF